MLSPNQRSQRARIAALKRHRGDEPHVEQLQQDYRVGRLADHIRELVNSAPALTPEQCDRLSILLRGDAA